MKQILGVIVLLISLSSCQFNSQFINRVADKTQAEQITNKFYTLVKEKNFEGTVQLFSNKFLEVTPKDKLLQFLVSLEEKLGDFKSANVKSWETFCIEGSHPSSKYTLAYKTKYEKFDAEETISLKKDTDGVIRIYGYHVSSDGFLSN